MYPPPAPTKAADPTGAAHYAMPKGDRKKMAEQFWNARAAMYRVAPPMHTLPEENEFNDVENARLVELNHNIPFGNAPGKPSTKNPFGNLGRLPGEPPAAPKKSRRQRRQRRRATRRRMH
jgi:hypothetical protein